MSKKSKMTNEQLASKWIKELEEAGYTPDHMIKIFRMAGEIYKQRRYTEKQKKCNHSMILKPEALLVLIVVGCLNKLSINNYEYR
jgi:hypothetical protein